jgi:hypothetical protein
LVVQGIHCDICICVYNVSFCTPSIFLLYSLPPFLRTILMGFIVPFLYMYTKCINHIHPLSSSSFTLHQPTCTYPWAGPVLHVECSREVAMVFHTCIYYTLIRLNTSITYSFSIALLCSTVSVHFYILSSYTDLLYFDIICFNFFKHQSYQIRTFSNDLI